LAPAWGKRPGLEEARWKHFQTVYPTQQVGLKRRDDEEGGVVANLDPEVEERAMRALEELAGSGSEFFHNPERCVEAIERFQREQTSIIVRMRKRLEAYE